MDVASIIAKEVVQEVGGSGDKLGEVERVEGAGGSEERTMNVEPAEEIESPASSPRIEPLSLSPSLAKGDSGKKKKKKLRKKVTTPSPSSPLDETPSPPRDDTVVLILSSSEKGTLAPKVIPGSTVSESSDMDDLGESSEEGEETSGGSKEPDQGDEDQAGRLQERQGELSHSQAQDEASGPEPSEHSLFPDRQGGPRWKVKPHNAPILRALE